MIILCNLKIAELIKAGCTFKSDIIISKNKTKKRERETKTKKGDNNYYNKIITTFYNKSHVYSSLNLLYIFCHL